MVQKNRTELYKYVTIETCIKTFQNMTVQWSSPLIFNDPFDTQIKPSFGDNYWFESVKHYVVNEILSIKSRAPVERDEVLKRVGDWIKYEKTILKENQKKWLPYAKGIRLFCLTETFDNLLMWAHYTKDHKGAVLKFRNVKNSRLKLNEAGKVKYLDHIPRIALVMDDFISYINKKKKHLDLDNFFFDLMFTKGKDWSYEKEWRCVSFIENKKNFNEYKKDKEFLPREIESLYLGCKMPIDKKDNLINLAKRKVKNISIYEAKKNVEKFALDFTQIV